MASYQIITDSCCDFRPEKYTELGLTVQPLMLTYRGHTRPDRSDDSIRALYTGLRAGEAASTAAVNPEGWAALIRGALDAGQDVAMLNLGDVSIYATWSYLMEIFKEQGYETVMVPGVPSFCAVAARLGVSLTEMNSPLHIAPGGMALDEVLDQPGTKVLMKSGRQMPAVLDALAERDMLGKSMLVQNCGLPGETVYPDLSQSRPEGGHGYFSTVIVKE